MVHVCMYVRILCMGVCMYVLYTVYACVCIYVCILCVSVQCVIWDADAVLHTCVHINPALCVYA